MKNKPNKIITHTAVSLKKHTAEDVDIWHKQRWKGFTSKIYKNAKGEYWTVGYHTVIEWSGKIVHTRGYFEEGAHTKGQNTSSIGVCFMGNGDKHLPSENQKKAWKKEYELITNQYPRITPSKVFPHRKYANKTCHGALLSDDYYAKLVKDPKDDIQKTILQLMLKVAQLRLQLLLQKISTGRGK